MLALVWLVGWLVGVAVVVELCVSIVGCAMSMKVWRCAFWNRCNSRASRANAQSASVWYYWPRIASMLGWLVFRIRMGVPTTRNLI